MSSNRSFLDSLNAGRQRRPHASLEDLNRTLDDLESRFGKLQQPVGGALPHDDDRRTRRLAGSNAYETPRHEPAPIRAPAPARTPPEPRRDAPEALSALRREIERSRQQAAGASALADISDELKALREEMRHEMTGSMRREFDALRQDIGRAAGQERGAPDGRDVAAEIERLSQAIHGMADRSDDDGLRLLRAEMEQVRQTLAELAREETVRSMDSRWAEFEERAFARQAPDPAIQALTERLEKIGEAVGNLPDSRALRSLEDKVRTLATAVDHFSRQAAQPDETYESIENRLDEISRAIVATSLSPKPLQPEPFERIEARIATLAAQLDEIAGRSGTDELLDRLNALSRRVEEIAHDAAMPDQAVERLGRQIAAIYDRLENDTPAQEREQVLDSLERRFAEIAALFEQKHDSATAQGQAMMRDMDRRLEELAVRLDRRAADELGVDAALLQALDEKFADLSDRIESSRNAAPDPRLLAEFDRRLNGIANRLDDTFRQAADVDPLLLRALDEKFADLSERIDSRPGTIRKRCAAWRTGWRRSSAGSTQALARPPTSTRS
jgi:localization factor PodJL